MVFCKQTKLRYNKLTKEKNNGLLGLSKKPNWRKAMYHNGVKVNSKYTFGKYYTEGEVHEKSLFDNYIICLGMQRPCGQLYGILHVRGVDDESIIRTAKRGC